ncbi:MULTISPECIES: hypothetical protein [Actinoplanes]|uniref:Uncharacterized protein n=2 Tax=Actinoplanes TaxID=1865 RepID=A0A101JMF1_9ACTN|nr:MULTISPECIES: hypothetical protein [Actinoplanes]KUL29449.1 hypothetical protein ADL15_27925 [Actinoplanes awajinensis subsp. mycoplanecinus]GIE70519.1 hypothetical protein Apa02nite_066270 [Actinoplanes palleronii]
MRQAVWLVFGLILLALGAQGVIRLVVNQDAGALRWLPGGYFVQLGAYVAAALIGLRVAKHNRVRPDPHKHP